MRSVINTALITVLLLVLAGVPWHRYGTDGAERARASTAFSYLQLIEAAQERAYLRNGRFASDLADLGLEMPIPRHFKLWVAPNEDDGQTWQMQLTRVPGGGAKRLYSIVWENTGYSRELSVIDDELVPLF